MSEYTKAVCKGSYLLGSACGSCERCFEEWHKNNIASATFSRIAGEIRAANPLPSPQELAARIRDKVADLNDELTLAALVELDVEFALGRDENSRVLDIKVWCSQEV